MAEKAFILDYDFEALAALMEDWGEPSYRAEQIWQGLYQQLWHEMEAFTPLPLPLRERLDSHFTFHHLEPKVTLDSEDGQTRKTLFRLPDGEAIEAVLMRYDRRKTLCISTQAGCAMGCVFCATGQMGFRSNLSSGEILEQVLYYARLLNNEGGDRPTNVVMMGMGEPFHNYEATLDAIERLNHHGGFNMGMRRFTISTVGLIPMIERFTQENRQINLAISLHAVDDELRSSMLPINRKYPVDPLLSACRNYVEKTHRRITFEWALIQGVNDSLEQAAELGRRLQGMLCHVNLIPLNPTQEYGGQASTDERAEWFRDELRRYGIPSTIRLRRGIDIQAGCGQLATEDLSTTSAGF
jgi:23S rRNA (adenine2503-C2)-methyltransferase